MHAVFQCDSQKPNTGGYFLAIVLQEENLRVCLREGWSQAVTDSRKENICQGW